MRTQFKLVASSAVFLFCTEVVDATDYGNLVATKVRQALGGRSTEGFVFATYPVDNFGLATAYSGKVQAFKMDCATWDCLGLSDSSEIAAMSDLDKLHLKVKGVEYAQVGSGHPLKLTADESRSLGINAVLPALLKILNISGNVTHNNEITTELETGPIFMRVIRRREMSDRLNSPAGHPLEKISWANGDLIMVYADIVAPSMTLKVTAKPETKVELAAKLAEALKGKKVGEILASGTEVSFKLSNKAKGEYSFEVAKPLVLAVLARKAPQGKWLASSETTWTAEDLGASNKLIGPTIQLPDIP